jgi:hypothetical protein
VMEVAEGHMEPQLNVANPIRVPLALVASTVTVPGEPVVDGLAPVCRTMHRSFAAGEMPPGVEEMVEVKQTVFPLSAAARLVMSSAWNTRKMLLAEQPAVSPTPVSSVAAWP